MGPDPIHLRPEGNAIEFIVLDTNIVLDLFVFKDVAAAPVRQALQAGLLQWIATVPMREELERVLGYPRIVPRLSLCGVSRAQVLAQFDAHVRSVAVAARAPFSCKDPDDQPFIDLAVMHRASLLSKDKAVLCMARRVQTLCARALIYPPAQYAAQCLRP